MQKGEAEMKRKTIMTRIDVDPQSMEAIEELADREGRKKQRQLGIILENVARLRRESPRGSFDLSDILNPPKFAAVA